MKRDKIEEQLRLWFGKMLLKYTWLKIKFEYSEIEKCYMVSFSPSSKINVSEEFSKDALDFEDKMNLEYGDDAPLFCDEESLFKLSSNAEVLAVNEDIVKFEQKAPIETILYISDNFNFIFTDKVVEQISQSENVKCKKNLLAA